VLSSTNGVWPVSLGRNASPTRRLNFPPGDHRPQEGNASTGAPRKIYGSNRGKERKTKEREREREKENVPLKSSQIRHMLPTISL